MDKILFRVYKSPKISLSLRVISAISVIVSVFVYCLLLTVSFYSSILQGAALLCSTAIPFFIVGFVRSLFDAPRPYELYDFYEIKPKERAGRSFPSRHAYSIFAISTVAFSYSALIGACLLVFAFALCASRVLLGIHFIRDVLAGGIIGVISGLLGIFLILNVFA